MADSAAPTRLTVTEGGPYVVEGGPVPVRRRRIVTTDAGEPTAWETHEDLGPAEEGAALCRCGHSGDKPWCDGSHETADWDGTENAPTAAYDERATTYEGSGLTMRDDRGICEHAGFCATKATTVWKMVRHDDVADPATRASAVAMIEKCPSGALTHRVPGQASDVEPDLDAAINVVDDGPLALTGGIEVQRADGETLETRSRMTLCRCGASGIKPLCDGSHEDTGFADS